MSTQGWSEMATELERLLAASILAVRGKRIQGDIEARLLARVAFEPTTGCWLWFGSSDPKGYGRMSVSGYPTLTHRVSWSLYRGSTGGLCVLHKCDTPACCNPDHLFLGTVIDNNNDMVSKGRYKATPRLVACKRGHPLSGDNLRVGKDDQRSCRTCRRACAKRRETTRAQENARARELYWANVEENRRRGREKQRRYR